MIGSNLSQPEKTTEMARKAMEQAQREHTHRHRVERLLDMISRLRQEESILSCSRNEP